MQCTDLHSDLSPQPNGLLMKSRCAPGHSVSLQVGRTRTEGAELCLPLWRGQHVLGPLGAALAAKAAWRRGSGGVRARWDSGHNTTDVHWWLRAWWVLATGPRGTQLAVLEPLKDPRRF